ncbi:NAC domain containing protein 82 [Actinidia rufa]|uniref:NAC domain containing protein 82 n=1 Tax=Actinidia rufa TaxID=165716 RepID=A0A7J0EM25_9ERIC|nr:NAC domain containing protein 82 [Actinidia rufa]
MARPSLPPGFRFHPTDVELVKYYLKRKVMGKGFLFEAISELNIYKFSPSDLPDKSCLKSRDREWYFFCPTARKYSSGARTNRSTGSGYWKSTGKARSVLYDEQHVGSVKTLVFHTGQSLKGKRTDWVMYEYKIQEKELADAGVPQDAYVLCKIFQKSGPGPKANAQYGAPFKEEDWDDDAEFCGPSLQSNSLPSPALPYDKENSVGTSAFIPGGMSCAPLSMPGPSNILPSMDVVPQPGPENDDYISLLDIDNDKEHRSSLPDYTVSNKVVENFTQASEYGAIPFSGGHNEGFVELNDLDGTVKSADCRPFIPDNLYVPGNDNYMEQDCFPADSFSTVQPVSAITQLPLQSEGSNGHNDHFFAFLVSSGVISLIPWRWTMRRVQIWDSPLLEFRIYLPYSNQKRELDKLHKTRTDVDSLSPVTMSDPVSQTGNFERITNRGVQQRNPYSRLQRLLESIPAHNASAVELFAPAIEAERCDDTIVFSPYGGSSFHVKAEVTRRGGACTKDALSENLGESLYSYSGFNPSLTGKSGSMRISLAFFLWFVSF